MFSFVQQKKIHPRKIVYTKALSYAKEKLVPIPVEMGEYEGSQKCQHVARQFLEEGRADSVVAALSFIPQKNAEAVNVHFINKKGEVFVDNTLGYLSKDNEYFLIKEFSLKDLENVKMTALLLTIKDETLSNLFSKKELKKFKITTAHI